MKTSTPAPFSPTRVAEAVRDAPPLPSLRRVHVALGELLGTAPTCPAQVAEIIRRDPGLTTRLLEVATSSVTGPTGTLHTVEEAVFRVGLRRIRQLGRLTPRIEDLSGAEDEAPFPWREFWQHCLGTAILTQEVMGRLGFPADELGYLAGLLHDVGRLVMVSVFPEHFAEIRRQVSESGQNAIEVENRVLGLDHARLGGLYLASRGLPDLLVQAACYHHCPRQAQRHRKTVAAVQIADLLAQPSRPGRQAATIETLRRSCEQTSGWSLLHSGRAGPEPLFDWATLHASVKRLPDIVAALV